MSILPWQQPLFSQFIQWYESNNLAHALLLTAVAGSGKHDFAQKLAQDLLCNQGRKSGCFCHSCELFAAGTHPDFEYLTVDEDAKSIKVDAIRLLGKSVYQTPSVASCRVIVVEPATKMNLAASNALLKILEEPPENTFFILLADQVSSLLPTIASRCQKFALPTATREELQAWLSTYQANADLSTVTGVDYLGPLILRDLLTHEDSTLAQALAADLATLKSNQAILSQLAKRWTEYAVEEVVAQWIYLLAGQIRTKSCEQNSQNQVQSLFAFLNKLYTVQKGIQAQHNLNQQLLYESLLIDWQTM